MAEKSSGQFGLFLNCLDKAFSENQAEPMKCCSIQAEYLSLLTLDILNQFLEILEVESADDDHIEHTQEHVQNEIVIRHLIKIPRDFHELHSYLQHRFPDDTLTKAVPELIQIVNDYSHNWIELESALLSKLRTLREDSSRFDESIGTVLDTFSPEIKSRAYGYIIFVRRSSDKSDAGKLYKKYLRPAFVRRIETTGRGYNADQIFLVLLCHLRM